MLHIIRRVAMLERDGFIVTTNISLQIDHSIYKKTLLLRLLRVADVVGVHLCALDDLPAWVYSLVYVLAVCDTRSHLCPLLIVESPVWFVPNLHELCVFHGVDVIVTPRDSLPDGPL